MTAYASHNAIDKPLRRPAPFLGAVLSMLAATCRADATLSPPQGRFGGRRRAMRRRGTWKGWMQQQRDRGER